MGENVSSFKLRERAERICQCMCYISGANSTVIRGTMVMNAVHCKNCGGNVPPNMVGQRCLCSPTSFGGNVPLHIKVGRTHSILVGEPHHNWCESHTHSGGILTLLTVHACMLVSMNTFEISHMNKQE